jgi:hypothetical protein
MTAKEALENAKELITSPDVWWDGLGSNAGKLCAVMALDKVTRNNDNLLWGAYGIFQRANGLTGRNDTLSSFNDSHTHTEVLEAFDKAIELAKCN